MYELLLLTVFKSRVIKEKWNGKGMEGDEPIGKIHKKVLAEQIAYSMH